MQEFYRELPVVIILVAAGFLTMVWVESKLASLTLRVIALLTVFVGTIFVVWKVIT